MGRKLLIIDDQEAVCRSISLVAGRLGFDVQALSDSHLAAHTFRMFRPDLVILDLIMPGIDGIDVLRDMLSSGIPARIVLTSGQAGEGGYARIAQGVVRFHGLQPLQFLLKPFRQTELLALLNDVSTPSSSDVSEPS